jgi:hypothetical protein
MAQLRVDSKIIKNFNLKQNQTFTYRSKDGDYNKIEVRDGKIGVIFANCPDQLCVRKGFIDKTGQTIICLPHKLVIEVMRSNDDNNINKRIINY